MRSPHVFPAMLSLLTGGWLTSAVLGIMPESAQAQITPDRTLGAERSRVIDSRGNQLRRIEGGAQRGSNLFHSFREFNVRARQQVYFNNSAGVENIIGRVTGRHSSHILGRLGVEGTANLFLLNPNGILFGAQAELDIQGSFTATAADQLQFAHGDEFSAVNPQAPPLLLINLPLGLQYGTQARNTQARNITGNITGNIISRGNLAVGQNLTLAGHSLKLQGQLQAGQDLTLQAQERLQIRDSLRAPFIASANGQITVQGNQAVDIFTLNHPDSGFFAGEDLILRAATVLGDAHYWSGGNFRVEQPNGQLGDLFSPYDPIIRAAGDVSIDQYTGASLHILAGGSITLGDVIITGADPLEGLVETIRLSNGTSLSINGKTQPTLDLRAGVDPAQISGLGLGGQAAGAADSSATGANIRIGRALIGVNPAAGGNGLILLTNQYHPDSTLTGGTIEVRGPIVTTNDFGNSGAVVIDSRNRILIGGDIFTTTRTDNAAGDITLIANHSILAGDALTPTAGALISSIGSRAGSGGDITIQTGSLLLRNSSLITSSVGTGDSGDLTILARDTVRVTNSSLNTDTAAIEVEGTIILNVGDSGNITIETGQLILEASAISTAAVSPTSSAGNLTIQARDQITLDGQSIFNASAFGGGDAGNIRIEAQNLTLQNGSGIALISIGEGNAGNLSLKIDDSINLLNPRSSISTSSFGARTGGDIQIETGNLNIRTGASLLSNSFDAASFDPQTASFAGLENEIEVLVNILNSASQNPSRDGTGNIRTGNISIRAAETVNIGAGGLISTAASGQVSGGQIVIETPQLTIQQGGIVRSNVTGSGTAGSIRIQNANLVDIAGGLLAAEADEGSTGNAGNISLMVDRLLIREGGVVTANTFGEGNAGDLTVRNADRIQVTGQSTLGVPSRLSVQVNSGATGRGGNLTLSARQVTIRDTGIVAASTASEGDAGNLTIQTDRLSVQDRGQVTVSSSSAGTAGNLEITARILELANRARLTAETLSAQGGNIKLQVSDRLRLRSNSEISASTQTGEGGTISLNQGQNPTDILNLNRSSIAVQAVETGTSGTVNLNAAQMTLSNQSRIAATTTSGEGGDIDLQGLTTLQLNNSEITTSTQTGQAGDLIVSAARRHSNSSIGLNHGSRITVAADEAGKSGNIALSTDRLSLSNSEITASAEAQGQAGNIQIVAVEQLQSAGGSITTNANRSRGGNIQITGSDIDLREDSNIRTDVERGSGDGGDIAIDADTVRLQGNSDIQTRVGRNGAGSGGNIAVTADFMIALDDSDIITESPETGGDITLNTPAFFGDGYDPDSAAGSTNGNGRVDLDASGSISSGRVQTPDTSFIQNSLADLPNRAIDTEALLANSCIARTESGSTFLITGTGGLPPNRPGSASVSPYPTDTVRRDTVRRDSSSGWQSGDPIVEPQGVYRLPNGEFILMHNCLAN